MRSTPFRSFDPALVVRLAAVAAWVASALPAQLTDLGSVEISQCAGPEACEASDRFGSALAVGDFDHDGFADLAVGVPGETTNGASGAGLVQIFYGSKSGLAAAGGQVFTQESSGVPGASESNDHFGAALAAGDLDEDGFDDLAIGVPDEDIGSVVDAGMVVVLFGSASGLTGSGALEYDQSDLPPRFGGCPSTVSESAEASDHFGYSVAIAAPAGLTHRLVIGVPTEDGFLFGQDDAGEVVEISFFNWVSNPRGQSCASFQDTFSLCNGSDGVEAGDQFGRSVGVRLMSGSDPESLGGLPFEETASGVTSSGAVAVYDGPCLQQNGALLGSEETGDRFGGALVAGDFDDDGFQDLAIGVAGEGVEAQSASDTGAVAIVFADASDHLATAGNQLFTEDDLFPDASLETGDHFGASLAAGDFDGDGRTDLAVGAPDDNPSGHDNAGQVGVFYSAGATGLGVTHGQAFDQDHPAAIASVAEANDHFGQALAAGDFDGNGVDDLAVGVPGEDNPTADIGVVDVLYGLDRVLDAFGTVSFTTSSMTVTEGQGTAIVVVQRTGGAVLAASVDHQQFGGTATNGVDYSYTDGTFTWSVGDLTSDAKIFSIHDDSADEPVETIELRLVQPSAGLALGAHRTLLITIQDDDPAGQIFADGFESAALAQWSSKFP